MPENDARFRAKLRRIVVFHYDYEQVKEFSAELAARHHRGNDIINKALMTGLIMAYSRPFSGNDGGNVSSAVTCDFSTPEQDLHERLVGNHGLRNSLYAHSDHTVHDLTVSVVEIGGERVALPMGSDPYRLLSFEEVNRLGEMARKIQDRLSMEQLNVQQKVEPDARSRKA